METLRDLRLQTKKTVAEVAQVLGVTDRAVYNYENGIRRLDITHIIPLSELFDCSIEEVLNAALNTLIAIG